MIDLIYNVLSNNSAVTDEAGDHIYPEYREPGSGVPAIVIDLIGVSPLHAMKSRVEADRVEVDVTCFHTGVGAVIGLGNTVRGALEAMSGDYALSSGVNYTVADSKVYGFSTDTDYDGRVCAVKVSVSFSINY